jgi:hypothetical protein
VVRRLVSISLDVAVVVAFVLIGRRTHAEGVAVADVVSTAAPFLIALAAAHTVGRRLRTPEGLAEGIVFGLITGGTGTLLRRVAFGDGIEFPFVLVTTGVLVAGMAGWRLVRMALMRTKGATAGTTIDGR